MKYSRLLLLLLTGCGQCQDPHTVERVKIAEDVGKYNFGLELCIQEAIKAKESGVSRNFWVPEAQNCFDIVGMKYGKKKP